MQKTLVNWGEDNVPRLAAAFSFYAMLSLAPVLVMAVVAGSVVIGKTGAQSSIMAYARDYLGPNSGELIRTLLKQVANAGISTVAGVLSLLLTIYGASNLFLQLEEAANSIWGIKTKGSFIRNFFVSRLLAFVMVVVFGAVTLGWLAIDSWLSWLGRVSGGWEGWKYVSLAVSVVFLTAVFGCAYKWLPKGMVAWKDVWLGAVVAALGVAVSKYLIGLYFAYAGIAAAYGTAGSLVVMLLWIYYTSQIFFFGFEITNTYAFEYGSHMEDQSRGLQYS